MQRNRFVRLYRDWCVVGTLACAVAGFPATPVGPMLLWAVILPALAGWLLWERPRVKARPERQFKQARPAQLRRQARRRTTARQAA
jgi:hypothetical protein